MDIELFGVVSERPESKKVGRELEPLSRFEQAIIATIDSGGAVKVRRDDLGSRSWDQSLRSRLKRFAPDLRLRQSSVNGHVHLWVEKREGANAVEAERDLAAVG